MSAAFERTVVLLGEMSPAELEQLGARVAALRAISGPVSASPLPRSPEAGTGPAADAAFTPLLYEACASALQNESGVRQPALATFLRTKAGARFVRASESARQAHDGWFPTATRVETARLTRIYACCLLHHLQALGHPLHWSNVCSGLSNLPAAVDRAFPGYCRSGLLSLVRLSNGNGHRA